MNMIGHDRHKMDVPALTVPVTTGVKSYLPFGLIQFALCHTERYEVRASADLPMRKVSSVD